MQWEEPSNYEAVRKTVMLNWVRHIGPWSVADGCVWGKQQTGGDFFGSENK